VGEFTTDEALTRILSGTGLTYRYLDAKTVTILPASAIPQGSTQAQAGGQGGATSPDKEGKKDSSRGFRVAQVDQGQTSSSSTVEKQNKQISHQKPVQLEEVVVTGSRIPTRAGESARDVRIYNREQIEQSGQTSVSDFLNTLPSVSLSLHGAGFQLTGFTSPVTLHGLPTGTTLVLINGRRVEGPGVASSFKSNFFDLDSIPLFAIARIEVLSEGSSAVYGSDAIAGVVNIILKPNIDGICGKHTVWPRRRIE